MTQPLFYYVHVCGTTAVVGRVIFGRRQTLWTSYLLGVEYGVRICHVALSMFRFQGSGLAAFFAISKQQKPDGIVSAAF